MRTATGTAFGRYRLLREIASDAVSTIYFATIEAGLSRPRSAGANHFAVRIAERVDPNDQDAIDKARQYLTQAQQAGIVDHPAVVRPRDAGIIDGQAYVATPFVRAVPLGELLAHGGTINQSAALAMFAQLAGALDVAHRAGVVHGALSPRTIWVGPSAGDGVAYVAYLTGFGTATLLRDRLAGAPPGAPEDDLLYVAPEQVRGDAATGRTDQYALACAVYHTLAGHPPFERDTRSKLYGAHLLAPPPQLDVQSSAVGSDTSAALLTAMSKDPGDRHPSCGTAIHEALPADAPPPAREVAGQRETSQADSPRSGWRSWWPFAVAALAAAVAFAVLWVVIRPDDDQASAREVSAKAASQPVPARNQGGGEQGSPQGVVWDVPVVRRPITQIEVVDDALVVTDGAGVAVVDTRDGAVRWRQNVARDARVVSNAPVLAYSGDVLTALELSSGDTSWFADGLGRVQSLAALDQTVVAAWGDQSVAEVTAVDRTDGVAIWHERVAGTGSAAAPTVAAGNHRAYVLHGTTLGAIDPPRAAAGLEGLTWQQEIDAAWPVLVPAGSAVIAATQDGRVCRYAGSDGAVRWCEAVAGVERAQPHILMAGDLVVIATSEGVVALDSASGRLAWNASPGGAITHAVAGGSRVVVAGSAGLRVLDAKTGDVAGEQPELAGVTALAMRGRRLYLGSHAGGVMAIDLRQLT